MASTPIIDSFVAANAAYSSALPDSQKNLPLPPAKKYAIVTCIDARLHPTPAFGVQLGDAHIMRNAGGSARDALRSLVISQQLLGTEEILVVKHTDCGMLTFTNDDIYAVIQKNLNTDAGNAIDFLPFPELEQAVKDDVEFLKGSPLIRPDAKISGWVYELESGKVRRVV